MWSTIGLPNTTFATFPSTYNSIMEKELKAGELFI